MNKLSMLAVGLFMTTAALPALAQVQITDMEHYDTQSQMLLANEINESGEPYAEAIGYDLDMLDPMTGDFPDRAAYVLGIENYEYSRYQLGVVVSRSGIGMHMMWAPVVRAMASMVTDPAFDGSMTGGVANGYNEDDVLMMMIMHFGHLAGQMPPMGAWPQYGEFISADPHYAQPVDADNFNMDFLSLRWDRSSMDMQLSPGAMGQSLMKQYLWAQDMLGSFHDMNEDEVVPDGIVSPDGEDGMFDPDNGVFYGGDNLDGFIGQVLTAEGINKVRNLIENLAFDGTSLGGVDPMTYDPALGLKYFPHLIAVTEEMVAGMPPRAGNFEVTDPTSDLFDQASLLWGTLSFKNMMDPANNSDSAHLAYHDVFDGEPFPADMMTTGTPGPFDLMKGTSVVIFKNMMAMHFDHDFGTFVDSSIPGDGQIDMGQFISTRNAAYTLVAFGLMKEEFMGTPLEGMADMAIRAQADFLISHLGDHNNLYAERTVIRGSSMGKHGRRNVSAQASAVRGLYAAYSATGDITYLDAADAAYMALIDHYYSSDSGVFRTRLNSPKATYTPEVAALLSGALREARLVGGHEEATPIYVEFWDNVVNKMQLAEGMASGETGDDSDFDGIPFIPEQPDGIAPVFAAEGIVFINDRRAPGNHKSGDATSQAILTHQNGPNPFNPLTEISFELGRSGHVALSIYNQKGQLVQQLVNRELAAGPHRVKFDGREAASGQYFYVLRSGGQTVKGKMTLLK